LTVSEIPFNSDGIIGVGSYELTMSARVGALVSPLTRYKRASIVRRDVAATVIPGGQRLFGRRKELTQLESLAGASGAIEVVGRDGIGKSALLRRLLMVIDASKYESMIYLHAAGMTYGDLLAALFHIQYDSEGYTPTYGQMQRYLSLRRALVILDHFDGSADCANLLVDAMPGSAIILGTETPKLPGRPLIEVGGLPKDDALELLEWASGETITDESLPQFENLVSGVQGRPLDLLRAAAADRAPRGDPDEIITHSKAATSVTGKGTLAPAVFSATSDDERSILGAFVAVNGAALDLEAIAAIVPVTGASRHVAALAWRGLLDSDSKGLWVRSGDMALAFAVSHAHDHFERAFAYFHNLCSSASIKRERLELLADAICRVLSVALARGRDEDVVTVGRPFADAAMCAGLLGKAEIALRCVSEAALRLKDTEAQSWALHQLGVLALCLDDHPGAQKSLKKALRMRERARDAVAISVTQRALSYVVIETPEPGSTPRLPGTLGELLSRLERRFANVRLPVALEPYRQYLPLAGIAVGTMVCGLIAIQVIRMLFPVGAPARVAGEDVMAGVRLSPGPFVREPSYQDPSTQHPAHRKAAPPHPAAPPAQATPQRVADHFEPQAPKLAAPAHARAAVAKATSSPRTVALAPRPARPSHPRQGPVDPQIISFDAEPSTITVGEYARLCAFVRNADSAKVAYVGAMDVGHRSCVNVSPRANQVYTLSVLGNGKEYRAYASVGVQQLPTRPIEESSDAPPAR
jgi:hypothetical protein